jgi:hypothetical protein
VYEHPTGSVWGRDTIMVKQGQTVSVIARHRAIFPMFWDGESQSMQPLSVWISGGRSDVFSVPIMGHRPVYPYHHHHSHASIDIEAQHDFDE